MKKVSLALLALCMSASCYASGTSDREEMTGAAAAAAQTQAPIASHQPDDTLANRFKVGDSVSIDTNSTF